MFAREPSVTLIDDDPSVCKAVLRLLESSGYRAQAYQTGQQFLDDYDPGQPGCLLMDLELPDIRGLELQDQLEARGDAPPIVFLTGQGSVKDCIRAIKHGAVSFLVKPVDAEQLLTVMHEAMLIDRNRREVRAENSELERRLALLTQREREVMKYVVAGWLNKQIAAELGTVEKTIKVHRARVMEKMCVHSLAELVLLASRAGVAVCPSLVPTAQ